MEQATIYTQFNGSVLRIHVKQGEKLRNNAEIMTIRLEGDRDRGSSRQHVVPVRAFRSCTVAQLLVTAGQSVVQGAPIAVVSYCVHPTAFKDLCVVCGEPVVEDNEHLEHSVLVAGGQSLSMTSSEVHTMGERQHDVLKAQKKLALIIDLDHTVLHATAAPRERDLEQFRESIRMIEVDERGRPETYYIKTRPNLEDFFKELSPHYRITIYTHGTRAYAESVAHLLDPKGTLFGQRIVSRTDTPNLATSKSLRKVFPSDPSMALILDDRDDVWEGPQSVHLLLARPYVFFRNAPEVNNTSGQTATMPEDLDTATEETDLYLPHLTQVLKYTHTEYFRRLESQTNSSTSSIAAGTKADAAQILQECYKATLKDVRILFSGLIPLDCGDPREHRLWRLAEKLGAEVVTVLSEATHLVTQSAQTDKSRLAIAEGDIFVVHVDWLLLCQWRLQRIDERAFLLVQLTKAPKLAFPEATTSSFEVSSEGATAPDDAKDSIQSSADAKLSSQGPKRMRLLKRRRAPNHSDEVKSSDEKANAQHPQESQATGIQLYLQADGAYTRTPHPTLADADADAGNTIALQEEYETALKIKKQVERLGEQSSAKNRAASLLGIPTEPAPLRGKNPEAFPADRVRRRSSDYAENRITADDFAYSEWPEDLIEYDVAASRAIDRHNDLPDDENDYQEAYDKQYADEYDEGYLLSERTEAPSPDDPDEMPHGDGSDVRLKAARGTSSPKKRGRNFPDVPPETAKRTKHLITESDSASDDDDADADAWVHQMEEEMGGSGT